MREVSRSLFSFREKTLSQYTVSLDSNWIVVTFQETRVSVELFYFSFRKESVHLSSSSGSVDLSGLLNVVEESRTGVFHRFGSSSLDTHRTGGHCVT